MQTLMRLEFSQQI